MPGSTTPACWSRSKSRTARCGTATRSARGWRWSIAALRQGRIGPYQLQAAIAAVHAEAASAEETDWPQIAALYGELARIDPNPVVLLNRAVAIGMSEGPRRGLTLIDELRGLDRYHLFHAARADLLRRLGSRSAAAEAYRQRPGADRQRRSSAPIWSAASPRCEAGARLAAARAACHCRQ